MIDFCDAAGEWGSIFPIPAREADRMIELADQRRIADLESPLELRDDARMIRTEFTGPVQDGLPQGNSGRYMQASLPNAGSRSLHNDQQYPDVRAFDNRDSQQVDQPYFQARPYIVV